jgi:hypothetical protein
MDVIGRVRENAARKNPPLLESEFKGERKVMESRISRLPVGCRPVDGGGEAKFSTPSKGGGP